MVVEPVEIEDESWEGSWASKDKQEQKKQAGQK